MRFLTVLICLVAMTPVWAQESVNPEQAFYRGRELFDKGDFGQAIEAYKSALGVGDSKELLFNLGTSCLFAGRDGEALYYLRRAERLSPRDEDIQLNIGVARSRAIDDIQGAERTSFVKSLLYFHEKTTFGEAFLLFALCYLGAMVLFHLRLIKEGRWFTRVAVVLMVVGSVMAYSLLARAAAADEHQQGVILPAQVDVFSGPSDHRYAVFFKLHSAAEVEVLEVKDGWVKIAVDEKKGYVPVNQIGLL
ncbi:MAG: tetratricopeptide (TPR) repeat protein [Planctomycetota bacterium]|jgi:tetratricopeptide (TPR) repeat protein